MGSLDGAVIWAVGLLVVMVIAISAVLPGVINAIDGSDVVGTSSGEVWAGTAATAHAMTYKPIVDVTVFKKAAVHNSYNDTKLVGANGNVKVAIDSYAAHDGVAWSGVNVTFTLQGLTVGNNTTWVVGDCNAVNKTWTSSPQTYTGIASTCLTPGSSLTFNFVNGTEAGVIANVTNVSVTYMAYDDNTAYTLSNQAGTITPTASGYYYTTYTYGTTGTYGMKLVLDLVPLMIAVIVLLLVITSASWAI